jgi:hypothetical protein
MILSIFEHVQRRWARSDRLARGLGEAPGTQRLEVVGERGRILCEGHSSTATIRFTPGRNRYGVQGAHLDPRGLFLNHLGLFLRTSIPFIWRILSAFLHA